MNFPTYTAHRAKYRGARHRVRCIKSSPDTYYAKCACGWFVWRVRDRGDWP